MSEAIANPTGNSANKGTDAAVAVLRPRVTVSERMLRILVPVIALATGIALWHWAVVANEVPRYILPSPVDAVTTLYTDWGTL